MLQQTFKDIDNLEEFINRVKHDLSNLEAAMTKEETESGISHSLSHVMKPFFFVS